MIAFLAALAGVAGVAWGFWPIVRPLPSRPRESHLAMLEAQVLDDLPTLPVTLEETIASVPGRSEVTHGIVRGREVAYGQVYRKVLRDGQVWRVYSDGRQQLVGPARRMRRIG